MQLAALIEGADARLRGDGGVEIADLALDSRRVEAGSLFFCVSGMSDDGHRFAPLAAEAGAAALVVERELGVALPQVVVPDSRAAMAPFAARFFGDPSEELDLCAITGTNGKTTTAFLLQEIFEASGRQCGLIGTVKQVVGGRTEEVVRTTPEAIDLQRTIRRMVDGGDRACAIEVSSHALALGRVDCLAVRSAGFTNLTQDHLDFHSDMDAYFAAKRLLFEPVGDRRAAPAAAAVNLDDPYGARLADSLRADESGPELTTFSASGAEADLSADDVDFDASGARFELGVRASGERITASLPLPGAFNVENALAAIAVAAGAGIEPDAAAAALGGAGPVPGRMEPIEGRRGLPVLVDYAHTSDSLENVLAAARRLCQGRLICVFGCGGDRDRAKRPLMGGAAVAGSDLAIITSDNPRSEEPAAIIADILAGIGGAEGVAVEQDRRSAIALALAEAGPEDLVVVAGKGHEQGQEFADGRIEPFDDRDVVRSLLAASPAVGG